MIYQPLGRTGLSVSRLSYGAARPAPREDFLATVDACLDAGVNYLDTAHGYGDSEALLGAHLAGRWRSLVLSTKICPYASFHPRDPWVMTPDEVLPTLEESLRRLRRDHVEIVLAHGLRTPGDVDRWLRDGYHAALLRAREQGKVRFLGMSELSEADGEHAALRHALPTGAFDVVMLTLNFLLQTAAHSVLPLCGEHGAGAVVMMPLNQASPQSGLVSVEAALACVRKHLEAGHLPDDPVYRNPRLFDFLLEGPARSIPEAALRYVLAHKEADTVCVGTRKPERLRENLRALEGGAPYLPDGQLVALRALFGAIRSQIR